MTGARLDPSRRGRVTLIDWAAHAAPKPHERRRLSRCPTWGTIELCSCMPARPLFTGVGAPFKRPCGWRSAPFAGCGIPYMVLRGTNKPGSLRPTRGNPCFAPIAAIAFLAVAAALAFMASTPCPPKMQFRQPRQPHLFGAAADRDRAERRASDRAHHDAAGRPAGAATAARQAARPRCRAACSAAGTARRACRGLHRRRPVRHAVRSRLRRRLGRLRLDARPAFADRHRPGSSPGCLALVAAPQSAGACRAARRCAGIERRRHRDCLAMASAAASADSACRAADERSRSKPADFDAFERLLGEMQTAYGNEDLGALRERVTPEMLSYYLRGARANASTRRSTRSPTSSCCKAIWPRPGARARTNTPPSRCATAQATS